jgi:hypothetical protein
MGGLGQLARPNNLAYGPLGETYSLGTAAEIQRQLFLGNAPVGTILPVPELPSVFYFWSFSLPP